MTCNNHNTDVVNPVVRLLAALSLIVASCFAPAAYALDTGAEGGYMYADLFTPDGVFIRASGARVEGREALARLVRLNPQAPRRSAPGRPSTSRQSRC